MSIYQVYKMALKSVLGGKVRSFLTMLGVIIGVAAVISAVAFAQGSTKNVTDRIQSLGTNMIQVSITGRNSNRNVTLEEMEDFAEKNSDKIAAIAPQVNGTVTAKYGTKTRSTTLIGTSPDYEDIKSVHVQSGRFLLPIDVDYYQDVALIGTAVSKDIFSGTNPIGQKVKLNGKVFTVVGVLEERDGGQDQSDDDQIIIPISVAQRMLKSAVIRNFAVQAANADDVDSVMNSMSDFLSTIYKSTNSSSTPYRVTNQEQMKDTLNSVTSSMSMILGGIAAISLIVGGIGIMNIMLVSVTERTREIGIRKAIGAKKKNILIQFLIEALMVTGIGGILGVVIGVCVIKFIIGGLNIAPAVYSVPWMVLSFGISLLVGVIFGMFPAYKAANLNPIEALRFE